MMEPSNRVEPNFSRAAAASLAPVASMVPGTLNVCVVIGAGKGRLRQRGVGTNVGAGTHC